jgi:hypothetical protein
VPPSQSRHLLSKCPPSAEDSGQKNRRTRSCRTTRRPPLGTSSGNRR